MSHIVILGAGASRAAFPKGDRNGKKLPVMADLIRVLELEALFEPHGLGGVAPENFESVFSRLYEESSASALMRDIESRLREYFSSLQLPDEVTIYDRLILSLQPRDLIATFNWDPLLFLAYRRNLTVGRLPKIATLHGSVAVGACEQHRSLGFAEGICHECGHPYSPVKLLYPIRQKNYQADGFIAEEWRMLRSHMKRAYWLTIYGYSAPDTDVEAIAMLRDMAHENSLKDIGDVEVIDIKPRKELFDRWKPFIVRSHYGIHDSFDKSILARYPRRSAETLWLQSMELVARRANPFPETKSLVELQRAASAMHAEELASEKQLSERGAG